MQNRYLLLALAAVAILVFLPVFQVFHPISSKWQGVTPMFTGDSYYYYSRIREVADGNIFIGNPYYIEHNQEVAPAFFMADWLAAIPLWLGFSFTASAIINLFFWSIVFAGLFYFLLRQLNLSGPFCLFGTVLMYLEVYRLMFRPVSMQTVFPFFILFLLSFMIWYKNSGDKRATIFLTLSTVAAFYVYTYLWQIILVLVSLSVVYFYFIKDRLKASRLFIIILISHLLSLPLIFYTIKQITNTNYWQSMERIGLVYTHLPAANVIYSGIWIIIALVLLFFSYFWLRGFKDSQDYKNLFVFSALSGIAMLVVSGSNIITGKELENSQHIERFIIVWLVVVCSAYIFYLIRHKIDFKQINLYKKIVLLIFLLLCLVGVFRYLRILSGGVYLMMSVNGGFSRGESSDQDYSRPLKWLEDNEKAPKVVWTDSEKLNHYITILTKHYVLFEPSSPTYLMPTREIEERYLIYNYFNDLNQSDIENNGRVYGGVGLDTHQYKTHNRAVKVCRLFQLDKLGKPCGELTDMISFKGEEYFADLYRRYKNEIQPGIIEELKKYRVAYIIKDKGYDSNFMPEAISQAKLVYEDNRFLIYKFN